MLSCAIVAVGKMPARRYSFFGIEVITQVPIQGKKKIRIRAVDVL